MLGIDLANKLLFLLYDDFKMGTILYICSTVTAKVILPLESFVKALPIYIKYVALLIKKISIERYTYFSKNMILLFLKVQHHSK